MMHWLENGEWSVWVCPASTQLTQTFGTLCTCLTSTSFFCSRVWLSSFSICNPQSLQVYNISRQLTILCPKRRHLWQPRGMAMKGVTLNLLPRTSINSGSVLQMSVLKNTLNCPVAFRIVVWVCVWGFVWVVVRWNFSTRFNNGNPTHVLMYWHTTSSADAIHRGLYILPHNNALARVSSVSLVILTLKADPRRGNFRIEGLGLGSMVWGARKVAIRLLLLIFGVWMYKLFGASHNCIAARASIRSASNVILHKLAMLGGFGLDERLIRNLTSW